ncbi:MAG: hypothetical protein ACK5UQ_18875 [Planctomycetota bacterium]
MSSHVDSPLTAAASVATPSPAALRAGAGGGLSSALLLSGFARAAMLVVLLGTMAWGLGFVAADRVGMLALGVGAAWFASGAAVLLKGGFLGDRAMATMHGDGRLLAARLQSILAAGLGLKLATVTLGVLWLRSQQTKFELVTTFAVAFAAAALVCQVTVAGILWRALSRRAGPVGDLMASQSVSTLSAKLQSPSRPS